VLRIDVLALMQMSVVTRGIATGCMFNSSMGFKYGGLDSSFQIVFNVSFVGLCLILILRV
jgi:hypothetical protein